MPACPVQIRAHRHIDVYTDINNGSQIQDLDETQESEFIETDAEEMKSPERKKTRSGKVVKTPHKRGNNNNKVNLAVHTACYEYRQHASSDGHK